VRDYNLDARMRRGKYSLMDSKPFRFKVRLRIILRKIWREVREHWFYLSCQIVAILFVLWWFPYQHLPWAGTGVAVIAVLAALMSVQTNLKNRHKFLYFFLMAALLLTEFRAMRKDRFDNQESQRKAQSDLKDAEDKRLGTLLGEERENTKKLLDQESTSLESVLKQDQTEFTRSLSAIVGAHKEDEQQFANVAKSQYELSELSYGRLVPGDEATPPNACTTPENYRIRPSGAITTIYGDNADVGKLPHTVMMVGNSRLIGIDPIKGSSDVALSLDFRDKENRVVLRVDSNGTVNRSNLILLHPYKNVFVVQDERGLPFLTATYVNKEAFQVTGSAIYCGQRMPIDQPNMHGSCSDMNLTGILITAPSCPYPKPPS
jgi:hypothetical protein